jgi:hypothetical protein
MTPNIPNSALLGCRPSRWTISAYSSGFKPSAAISSGEKGAEEMVDMEPSEKWDKPNYFTDFWLMLGSIATHHYS